MKTPLALIDHLMPTLKDTELRILLLLLRRTAGFQRNPRTPVILRYRELTVKTGRHTGAISEALKSLERRGLIHSLSARINKQ